MPNCELCGLPMPEHETMFKFHGYSGPCPGPPLPKPEEPYHVTIQGQYDADSNCVLTEHGEALVAFETDAGSLAPLDGKAVEVTIQSIETNSSESKEPK